MVLEKANCNQAMYQAMKLQKKNKKQ
jgi:hypothetical protein